MTAKRLIVGSLPADYDPRGDILMGPWCYWGCEDAHPEWIDHVFPDEPFGTIAQWQAAEDLANHWFAVLAPQIGRMLDERNGTNLGEDFWSYFILPWLLTIVHMFIDRQARVAATVAALRDERMNVDLGREDEAWDFRDEDDFTARGAFGTAYNFWMLSLLLREKLPAGWIAAETILASAPPQARALKRKSLRSWLHAYRWASRCHGPYGLNPLHAHIFSLLLRWKHGKPGSKRIYEPLRQVDSEPPDALMRVCIQSIPRSFLAIRQILPKTRTRPGCWSMVTTQIGDVQGRVLTALRIADGERVVSVQHGGYYGNAAVFALVAAQEYKHDAFITWGWTRHGIYSGKFIPLPSPHLARLVGIHHRANDSIILVTTCMTPVCYRLDSIARPGDHGRTVRGHLQFLAGLSADTCAQIKYRPYPDRPRGLSAEQAIKARFPELAMHHGNLMRDMAHCALLVLDHPGTTLNIALAANIPVIGFWDPVAWPFCAEADEHYALLREAQIIHASPIAASSVVNARYGTVDAWWSSERVQSARRSWVENYAYSSRHWLSSWIKTLLAL
jgi:hypothetical protein